ncbi:MAG TPA: cbb3-type cytochrome c oxidase subunit 3 [Rhodanobacteraceae bacterium]|nr:cbb3-type cytochrome c oxidase subunit 3 [Rhodanobacteraceae bacterium]
MNPLWGHVAGVFILLMMATFIGIWIWAWLPRHQRNFKRMSQLPMEDDAGVPDHAIPPTRPEDRA